MHNHVANRGRKALLKQIFSVFLIFTLYFNSFNNAYAATVGGWSIGGLLPNGASSIVNGTKQVIIDGKNYLKKGTAKMQDGKRARSARLPAASPRAQLFFPKSAA